MPIKLRVHTEVSARLADLLTPVGIYLDLRDRAPGTLLLESADYRGSDNTFSYVCVEPFVTCTLSGGTFERVDHSGRTSESMRSRGDLEAALETLLGSIEVVGADLPKGVVNGLFGYFAYDAVQYFEDIKIQSPLGAQPEIPSVVLSAFRYVIAFDHFQERLWFIHNRVENVAPKYIQPEELERICNQHRGAAYPFSRSGSESSSLTDEGYASIVETCQKHIKRGDVFQIVPSRRFTQKFSGDDFWVYRALRSINPSPYLFYFDLGGFRIMGSSPEAQIVIRDGQAGLFPIAGTYPRSGNDEEDRKGAEALMQDPKENAEHSMLVDLARNDLSRHCSEVGVQQYREVQFYSHVIHLVSRVVGKLHTVNDVASVFADTFPAGTLTGAPKFRAMELIDAYEPHRRQFYGGALGFIGFDRNAHFAIIIRSLMSCGDELHYQAGAGIVFDSVPSKEVQEVHSKVAAVRKAIEKAEELSHA